MNVSSAGAKTELSLAGLYPTCGEWVVGCVWVVGVWCMGGGWLLLVTLVVGGG